jgi:Undecaprenyl-phosphate glucose phosphotransferase
MLNNHQVYEVNSYIKQVVYIAFSCWFASAGLYRLYYTITAFSIETIYRNTWKTFIFFSIALFLVFSFDIHNLNFKSLFILIFLIFLSILSITRFLLTILYLKFHKNYTTKNLVCIIGFNTIGINLSQYFETNPYEYNYTGILDENIDIQKFDKPTLEKHLLEYINLAYSKNIKKVFITLTNFNDINTIKLFNESENLGIKLKLVNEFKNEFLNYHSSIKDGFQFLSFRNEKLEEINVRILKRLFDIIFSTFVILFILSWLYPILAILIKLQSPGPVLFKQKRNGRANSEFICYKFRSMHINKLSDFKQAERNDNRFFPLGAFLRRTNIDELPQFLNVLFGEMSVVGPRPHMIVQNFEFKKIIDTYMVRNFIKPGITGLAQISGFRGETKQIEQMEARIFKDIEYLENWSFALDIKIVILTIYITLKGDKNAF